MTPLYEQFRPASLDLVIGQDKAVAAARRIVSAGAGGQAVWLNGPSGSGKTTIARIIAASIADEWMIREFDSGGDLSTAKLDEVLDCLSMFGAGRGGRAVIVNESHSLSAPIIDRLKGVLERIPQHAVWCFTTTREDEAQLFGDHVGAAQLLSRCKRIQLTNQGFTPAIAAHVEKCAKLAGLDGYPSSYYLKIAREEKGNARAIFQRIEEDGSAGAMVLA